MNKQLVQRLVEKGENLTLGQVVDSTRVCKMNCGLFGNPPGWKELFDDLRRTVDETYLGQVSWDVPYQLMRSDHANEAVSKKIKEKYIRILLFSKGER